MAYDAIDYVLRRYRSAGHIGPESNAADVLAALDAGVAHYGLEDQLSPQEFAELQNIRGIIEQRSQNPDDMRARITQSTTRQRQQQTGQAPGTADNRPRPRPQNGGTATAGTPQNQTPGSPAQARPQQTGAGQAGPANRGGQPDGRQAAPERAAAPDQRQTTETVTRVATGNAVINTNLPGGTPINRRGQGGNHSISGQNTFGPSGGRPEDIPTHLYQTVGSRNPILAENSDSAYAQNLVEVVSFTPAQEDVYANVPAPQPQQRRGFGRLFGGNEPQQAPARVRTGSQPVMVMNPATGQVERGVRFDYAYNPNLSGENLQAEDLGYPRYRECDGNRGGNNLIVSTVLPESVARDLQQQTQSDPASVRAVAEQIVLNAGGISREVWEQGAAREGGRRSNRVKPPYEELPSNHRIFMLDPVTDQLGRENYRARPL